MHRYFIQLSFDGTAYHGWQSQLNALSIQQVVAEKLSVILGGKVEVTGCGRTDAGVHAEVYYAHFDIEKSLTDNTAQKLNTRLNVLLPADIAAHRIFSVNADAHARFSAVSRTYLYRISRMRDPINRSYSYYYPFPLDVARMNSGAQIIMGYKDFSCFSKSHTQTRTNDCRILEAGWDESEKALTFTITADRFLRNMVRAIVGTLIDLGRGKISERDLKKILSSGDRSMAGKSFPAKGLSLTRVCYPENITI
jgi:tRNA pseudouridine38-40 synthase